MTGFSSVLKSKEGSEGSKGKVAFVLLAILLGAPSAYAVTSLKQVQISNGSQVDLLFDGRIQKSQIKIDFINDIIQLSIQDAAVYPAKISSVNGTTLTKIFAYQYAPKLIRCRLTVKGKAEDFKDRLDIKAGGRILTVRMGGASSAEASPVLPVARPATARPAGPAVGAHDLEHSIPADAEERALLNRVMAAGASAAAPAPAHDTISMSAAAPAVAVSTENQPVHLSGDRPLARLAGGKPLPSPLKAFGKMALVLGLFGLLALGFRKFAQNRASARLPGQAGWLNSLGQIAKKSLGRDARMIEVLSTHYLGPKKSIAVVRIAGRVLVLGVSNESINLITQLSGEDAGQALEGIEGLGLDLAAAPSFSNLLQKERGKPVLQGPAKSPAALAAYTQAGRPPSNEVYLAPDLASISLSGNSQGHSALPPLNPGTAPANARARIRNRMEGLKQL